MAGAHLIIHYISVLLAAATTTLTPSRSCHSCHDVLHASQLTLCKMNCRSISMRRTASWGSRDAFTDGHISLHADPPNIPQGRRTHAATTKAHRQKRCYPLARSSNYQAMHQPQQEADLDRAPSLSTWNQAADMMQRQFPSEEAARRMSAPEAPPGATQIMKHRYHFHFCASIIMFLPLSPFTW